LRFLLKKDLAESLKDIFVEKHAYNMVYTLFVDRNAAVPLFKKS